MKIDEAEFKEIFEDEEADWDGDNALQGLSIIAKYFDKNKTIVCGAGHDEIWSVDVDELIEAGITREDAEKLRRLNWMIEYGTYLACFV